MALMLVDSADTRPCGYGVTDVVPLADRVDSRGVLEERTCRERRDTQCPGTVPLSEEPGHGTER